MMGKIVYRYLGRGSFGTDALASQSVTALANSLLKMVQYGAKIDQSIERLTSLRLSSISMVVSQSTQASVILIPGLRALGPAGGTSCLPAWMLDSIMTPVMLRSPAASWSQMLLTTRDWLLWFF
jgi:hypothetical protein